VKRDTISVHGGAWRSEHGETSEAIFMTSGYVYNSPEDAAARFAGEQDGFIYSRYANPTVNMFEKRLAALEGAQRAFATASGMAAMTAAMMAPLRAGDHLVASRALFGSCHYVVSELLPRYGIATTLVDGRDLDQWRAALRDNTKMFFCESPSNPCLELVDLKKVADIAHEQDILFVVDNVFATPTFQRPIALGADVVAYSTTKHIDGQGRCLGGAIVTSHEIFDTFYEKFLRNTGPALSPFNAWVMLKGLETMDLRITKQTQTAQQIAQWMKQHLKIKTLLYPHDESHPQYELAKEQMSGGGSLICFDVGTKEYAFHILNQLNLIKISNNLGDARTLITHPASTTHARVPQEDKMTLGIHPGTLRISVGLEDVDDLIQDLKEAMDT